MLLTVGCGDGLTFGIAPGPPPPDPPPPPPQDAGSPPPDVDAGPITPQPDAGPNCTVENRAATPAESLAEFQTAGLPVAYGCASCHQGKSPTGIDIGWGATTNDAAGWHAAALALADRDSALAPTATSLFLHFDEPGVNPHPVNAVAKAGVLSWLDLHRNGVDEVVCVEPPVCPPTYRARTPAEIQADFNSRNIAGDYSCATCHQNKTPTGIDAAWGATTNDAAGWYAAVAALADRDTGQPNEATSLYLHFDEPGVNPHPVNLPARGRMDAWLTYRASQVEVPGVCEPPPVVDAGPDCTPVPVDLAGSEAEFVAQDLTTPYNQCANCHVGKSPQGSGFNWGADSNTPGASEWHEAARALWDQEGAASPEASELYTHFNGKNATHPPNAAAAGAMSAWLTYISSPQPPAGCE